MPVRSPWDTGTLRDLTRDHAFSTLGFHEGCRYTRGFGEPGQRTRGVGYRRTTAAGKAAGRQIGVLAAHISDERSAPG
jgi:hypothetical protein